MGETLLPVATSFNASLSIEARPERLTGDAGAVLVREVIERTGILGWMTARLHDPRQPHLVSYPLAERLRTMLVLFAQGWRDQDDADALRLDPALRCAVAGARGTTPLAEGAHLASQPTLSRLLDILTLEANRPVLREALAELAARRLRAERGGRRLRHLTIDVDGLPVEVHGAQPGSTWSIGSKAGCARSPCSAWTPASPRSGCCPASRPAAHPTSPGSATTGCSTAWPARISGGHPDGRRQSRGYGAMRWTIRPAPGRAPAASCWLCWSALATCCSTISGYSPASAPPPCRPGNCSPITASAAPPRATSAS